MSSEKTYAIVFPKGTHQIVTASWEKVKVFVGGVSGVKFKGFHDATLAEAWIETTKIEMVKAAKLLASVKKINSRNEVTNTEWMSKNVNTPFWKKIRKPGK